MKKINYIISSILLLSLVACNQEIAPEVSAPIAPEEGAMARVTFSLSMSDIPLYAVETKADLPDQPTIDDGDVYVAVFGGGDNEKLGGQLQHFLKATLVKSPKIEGDLTPPITHDLTDETDPAKKYKYEYEILLPLSNSPLVLDFLVGACDSKGVPFTLENPLPVQYEKDVMPLLYSINNEPAYWQRVRINGVFPKPKDGGGYERTDYSDPDDPEASLPDSEQDYIADEIPQLKDLQLVRNFAKITYKAADTAPFTIKGFYLVDTPLSGAVAPYSAAEGYNTAYTSLGSDNPAGNAQSILNGSYKGYVLSQLLSSGISGKVFKTPEEQFEYMYERTIPTYSSPVYAESGAILEVEWKNIAGVSEDLKGKTRYYKVSFVDEHGYIPILRNIQYTFEVSDIIAEQHPLTPAEAYGGGFLGDISANIATAMLDDITNNKSRITVSEMSKTAVGAGKSFNIDFSFYPVYGNSEVVVIDGRTSSAAGNKPVTIQITKLDEAGHPQAVKSISTVTDHGDHGTITVDLEDSEAGVVKKGKVKILGQVDGMRALYREVVFTVMEKQSLTGSTVSTLTSDAVAQDVTVTIHLPDELPRDIFPLQIMIEAENNGIYSVADSENNISALPAKHGVSAFDANKRNYYFVKTITFDEYATLNGVAYNYTNDFPCKFKTRLSSGNATTIKINDVEKEYFVEETLTLQ